jgi:DNA excision repair protein ERCC-2
VAVYRAITGENKLYAQAPTGIGKTLATAFPAVKSMGEGHISKIFYLTAKTITRTVAENAFENMRSHGLRIKTLILTAKEKICFKEGKCDAMNCPYAAGYFDKINGAVEDIFSLDSFSSETIQEYARKHGVCPFEFSLDLSLWVDCIICDYNYVFDPRVHLKRFFSTGGQDFAFLIDEAHNLVDRAREMFSAELSKKPFLELKRAVKKELPDLYKSINGINSYFIDLRKKCEEKEEARIVQNEPL